MSPFTLSTQVLFWEQVSGSLPFRGLAGGNNWKVGQSAQMQRTEEALGWSRTKLGSAIGSDLGEGVSVGRVIVKRLSLRGSR